MSGKGSAALGSAHPSEGAEENSSWLFAQPSLAKSYIRFSDVLHRKACALVSPNKSHLVVTLDERNVASFNRVAETSTLAGNEVLLRYRIRNGRAKFATNAFFFREGHAQDYQRARFGEFRVAPDGEAILAGLRDMDLVVLGHE